MKRLTSTNKNSAKDIFLVNVYDLIYVSGKNKDLQIEFESPEYFGFDLQGIQKGDKISLQIVLTSISDGIYLDGVLKADLTTTCSKCLSINKEEVNLKVCGLYVYQNNRHDDELGNEDMFDFTDNQYIDLRFPISNAVFGKSVFSPVCDKEECQSTFSWSSGVDEDDIDPRFAILKDFLK